MIIHSKKHEIDIHINEHFEDEIAKVKSDVDSIAMREKGRNLAHPEYWHGSIPSLAAYKL